MADGQSTQHSDARIDRRDAALVAEYIHELSERHGPEAGQAAPSAGTASEDSGDG